MANETRLVVEALLFVVGMLGVIGVAYVRGRQTGPTAVDNLRRARCIRGGVGRCFSRAGGRGRCRPVSRM